VTLSVEEAVMRHVVLAVAAFAAVCSGPASAQVYYEDERYGRGRYGRDFYEEYDDRPGPRYRGGPPRYDDEYPEYRPRRPSRRARLGGVCVTSRGSCDAGGGLPVNTPCSCFIPGFGAKRGAIGH
jgi:hypothetical protein